MADGRSVMIVGPVTWDVFADGRRAPGGTVSFAARVATAMGVRARVLTMADADADLSALEGHDVHVVRTPGTLTFAHTFADEVRTLRVLCAPGHTLRPGDAPPGWPAPDVLLVAPLLARDIDAEAFGALPTAECGVTAQGFLRQVADDGVVSTTHEPTQALRLAARSHATVFLSRDELAQWSPDATAELAARTRRLVVTGGRRGAEITDRDGTRFVPPVPAAALDTTGAGDVFATAFILALGEGEATAARLAAAYAAANVETVGPAPLPDRDTIERRLSDDRGDA